MNWKVLFECGDHNTTRLLNKLVYNMHVVYAVIGLIVYGKPTDLEPFRNMYITKQYTLIY